MAMAIFAVYLFITASVDLFHTDEEYMFGDPHADAANTIYSNNPCPACTFLAGHHSMGAYYAPALLNAELLFALQSLPPLDVVRCCEWAHSITSRAPPSTLLS